MAAATSTAHTNRLINETSPYLLQHAHNPVQWYAWGDEAFESARRAGKPIFLSVGYSTCYWCHVMERECFENEAIARIMNEHFVNIKVDREERPDVDDVYMTATQLISGHGGWPMSVWLEPRSLQPFLAGTYFPPDDRHGRPGFPTVLMQIAQAWAERREAIEQQAEQVADAVRKALQAAEQSSSDETRLSRAHVDQAVDALMRQYDAEHGGFGGSSSSGGEGAGGPKFPMPVNLALLMGAAWDREDVRSAVMHTLDRMAIGGIFDQIGGGFHRYSVDERWLVPHFEKMLYDNAQLAQVYCRAFELTGDGFYAEVARRTLEYVLREMISERNHGAFSSAQDAEVHEREGLNYLWTATEVREVLAEAGLRDLAEFALYVYGFDAGTNFRDPHHPEDGPKNVVHLVDRPDALARAMKMSMEAFADRIEKVRHVLLDARQKRDRPLTDDKVLAGWNGLMIAAMADGGRVLGERRFLDAARNAAEFVLRAMRREDGGLWRSQRDGSVRVSGFAEDYALIIHGLLALARATGEQWWIKEAACLEQAMRRKFFDERAGGYFDTETGATDLFVRTKGMHDGVVPSANSVQLLNLLRLREAKGDQRYGEDAQRTLAAMEGVIGNRPLMAPLAVLGLAELAGDAAAGAADAQREQAGPVAVRLVEADRDGGQRIVRVEMEIAAGHHINAHEPGVGGMAPLTISGEGVRAEARYPAGERRADGLCAHEGSVAVDVRIGEREDGGEGEAPRVVVSYQACTEHECLMPQTVLLPLPPQPQR